MQVDAAAVGERQHLPRDEQPVLAVADEAAVLADGDAALRDQHVPAGGRVEDVGADPPHHLARQVAVEGGDGEPRDHAAGGQLVRHRDRPGRPGAEVGAEAVLGRTQERDLLRLQVGAGAVRLDLVRVHDALAAGDDDRVERAADACAAAGRIIRGISRRRSCSRPLHVKADGRVERRLLLFLVRLHLLPRRLDLLGELCLSDFEFVAKGRVLVADVGRCLVITWTCSCRWAWVGVGVVPLGPRDA